MYRPRLSGRDEAQLRAMYPKETRSRRQQFQEPMSLKLCVTILTLLVLALMTLVVFADQIPKLAALLGGH